MSEHRPSFLWLPLALLFAVAFGYGAYRFQAGSQTEARAAERSGTMRIGQVAQEPLGKSLSDSAPPIPTSKAANPATLEASPAEQSARAAAPRQLAIDGELTARFDGLISTALAEVDQVPKAKRSDCAVSYRVIDVSTGVVLAERQPDRSLESASNMKLITSLAALWMLGADWCYETHVDAVGDLDRDRLSGDLVVRASGDPFAVYNQPENSVQLVAELAQAVAESGVKSVSGDLVIDRSPFMEPAPAAGWPNPNLYWTKSYALAGGLSVNAGLVSVQVEPTTAGAQARVRLVPGPTGLSESFSVLSDPAGVNDVRIGLFSAKNRLEISGRYGTKLPLYVTEFSHPRPEQYFAAVLRDQLASVGVTVAGELRVQSGAPLGKRLATLRRPWIEHLAAINTDSANSLADGLLMTMGAVRFGEGSRAAGARAVRAVLEHHGLPTEGLTQVDGSGLSRENRVTARLLSEVLAAVEDLPKAQRELFTSSLAVAGVSGTLEDRMQSSPTKGRVYGKTGWISGASSLSGYADGLTGRRLVFSILVAYPRLDGLNTRAWKPMQDRMCEALVEWRGSL
jgi:serine-type D-Ala-D-Ala carboxypeptidase/endopeptidase (penicillin-binding protein 4)